ncbi:hypothetical protein [Paenibacillus sp. 1P07SE]|uniref:hypothetical protein n=1 Tax=Paenibacillus sp. 1P07SE TaxID=3132209 RepID=UPI0039A53B7C
MNDVIKFWDTITQSAMDVASDCPLPVSIVGGGGESLPIEVVLQNESTAAGNGTPLTVGEYKTLTIEVYGTSVSRTVIFEIQSVSNAWYPIQGIKIQDYSMATQTTGSGEVWQFDITGVTAVRARISAVAGGNVSVRGRAVV